MKMKTNIILYLLNIVSYKNITFRMNSISEMDKL